MTFFAHDFWSLFYLCAFIVAGCVTLRGPVHKARRILNILFLNWVAVRFNWFFFDKDGSVSVAIGVLTFVALLFYGRSIAAYICAALFFFIVNIDFVYRSGFITYSDAATLWDIFAFIILIVMAGAANDFWRDRIAGRSDIPSDRLVPDSSRFVFRGYTTDDSVLVVEKTKGENK